MSIKPYASPPGGCVPWEYMEAAVMENCQVGLALTVTDGKLCPATGSTKPKYISMYGKPTTEGQQIPVIPVHANMKFVTRFSADASAVKVGDKVTIDESGLYATATTADGVLEIVSMDGTAADDEVIVRIT
ncbi:MAG: hypothetical protein J6K89_07805 [Oscillospiraceae bacterium]|nr:hypothetical protein [Oscillospiraceae bacterium]